MKIAEIEGITDTEGIIDTEGITETEGNTTIAEITNVIKEIEANTEIEITDVNGNTILATTIEDGTQMRDIGITIEETNVTIGEITSVIVTINQINSAISCPSSKKMLLLLSDNHRTDPFVSKDF